MPWRQCTRVGIILPAEVPTTFYGLDDELETRASSENRTKLRKTLREFRGYIKINREFIPNYGERYRNQERISTAFVESAVNQVISKRMVKKQGMQWSKERAHLLLQMRTRVLNGELGCSTG